jgi:hypothetical protein
MTSSDLLHKLIHSLSAVEKRYVKIFLKGDDDLSGNTYLNTLFAALLKQENYNEAELKNTISDPKLRRNFALYKNLLQEKVLDALTAFDRQSTPEHKIYRRLENQQALWQRGHLNLAEKELEKAQKDAQLHEHYSLLLEIFKRKRLTILSAFDSHTVQRLQNNIAAAQEALKKLENESEFNNLYDLAFSVGKIKGPNKIENDTDLAQIIANPLLGDEKNTITFDAKLKFYGIWSNYYSASGNEIGNLYHRKKIIEIWKQHPEKIQQLKWRYRVSLGNLGLAYHRNSYYHEFETLLSEMEAVAGKGKNYDPLAFRTLESLRQIYYVSTAQFSRLSELKKRLENGMENYRETLDIGFYITTYYNLSVAELIQDNYSEALKWLKKITDLPRHNLRLDIQRFIPAYRLMILYSHNSSLLEYDLRNAQRYYAKHPDSYREGSLESLVLKNIKTLYLCNSRNEKQTLLNTFNRDMEQLLAQPGNSNMTGIDEVYCWVKALLLNKPLLEVATPYLLAKNKSKQEVEGMLSGVEKGGKK